MSEPTLSSNSCPKCGAALPSAATAGLCPRCLMAEAMLPTQPDAGPAAARKPLAPEELAPHFPQLEILECLGRGGMGVVYKARQKTLNRFVALKLLAPERVREPQFAERFTREAQALAALNHPNIVTIYDFGQAGGFYFLLMEFVDGVNLRQLLRARKFTPEEALAIVPPLCDALQFAHDRGIVHRDIKPENLLLDKTGRVKVADFGIAKMIEPDPGRAGLPVGPDIEAAQQHGPTGVVGTPNYSAPEQGTDPGRVDSRADIYSLGVVFYEMLTGELPGKRLEPPSRKVHIDVRLDAIVLRALEQNPALRYQQVSEVKTMVETIVGTAASIGTGGQSSHSENGKLETARRFSRTAIAGACFGMVGLLALVLILFGSRFFVLGHLAFPFYTVAASMALCMLLFTTLGWVAVSQIKRSAGRLRGLWLAQIERLLFPMLFLLLVLDFLIIYSQAYITIETLHMDAFMNHAAPPPFHVTQATSIVPYESLVRIATAFICAVSNTLIAWGVWRAVNIGSPPPPPAASKNSGFGKLALGLFLVGTIGSFLLAIIGDGRGKLAAECASVALTLALILGLLNWRERLGKFAALATTGLFVALLLLAAHVRFVIVPAWWDKLQASFGPVTECTLPMDEDGWTPLFDLDHNRPVIDTNPGDSNNIMTAAQATTDSLKYVRDVQLRADLNRPGMAFQHDARKKIINCTAMSGMTVRSATDDQWGRITALAQVSGTLLEVGTELGGTQPYNAPDDLPQTIFLRTGQHRLGILQVTDFNDSEHWLKIRYKLAPQAPPQSIGERLISFGPIIERVVADSKADFKTEAERSNAPMMIDFDSGSLLVGPAAIWAEDPKAQRAWMQANGVDALGVIPQVNGLVALDMKVAAVPPSAWNMVPEPDFTNQLAGVTARETTVLSGQVGSFSTWFFQTRKGRMGILQITGLAENPPGVKIRYKLAQEWTATTPATGNTASNQEPQNYQWQAYPPAAAAPAAASLPAGMPVSATAAYTGDIAVRLDSLGAVESSNTVVFSIAQDYVQDVVKRLQAGQVLTVEAEDRDRKPFGRGALRGVDNQIDTATGMLKCTATLAPDGDNLMLRGLFLNIHLTLEVKHGVTLVPYEAIQRDREGAFAWVIKPDQTVSRRPVQLGTIDGAKAEIQSGLSPGELVVTAPANKDLRDGQKTSYTLEEKPTAPAAADERAAALQFRLVAPEGTTAPVDLLPNAVATNGPPQFRVLRNVLLDGSAVARAGIRFERYGQRSIVIEFTEAGGKQFGAITASNVDEKLAIVYHGAVLCAPHIEEAIPGGQIAISGGLALNEIHMIVDCLNRAPAPTEEAWAFTAMRDRPWVLLASPGDSGALRFPALDVPDPPPPHIQDLPDSMRSYLDLDTGEMATNDSVNWKSREGHDWISSNGLDLAAAVSTLQSAVMTGFDITIEPLPANAWGTPANAWDTVTAADVVQSWALMQNQPQQTATFVASPMNIFLFQTREGGRGILSIRGLAEKLGSDNIVLLSYKLVQQAGATKTNRTGTSPSSP